jgi:rod shape-determining protein MreB
VGLFSKNVAIDLGTTNVLIYVPGQGIVLREPSIAAVSDDEYRDVLEVGSSAKMTLGRTPAGIVPVYPLREGVIDDFIVAEEMLSKMLEKALKRRSLIGASSSAVVCVPCNINEHETKQIEKAVKHCGAKEVFMAKQPMAAAIGAGLPVNSPRGSMVVDIGGGTTEIAVVTLSDISISRSLRIGGVRMDKNIQYYVERNYNTLISDRTAEEVKIELGSAFEYKDNASIQIRGRAVGSNMPVKLELTSREVCFAIRDTIYSIIHEIRSVLELVTPEISSDILRYGITLSGGGALLQDMAERINYETQVPVRVAERPLDCVALGAGIIADQLNELKKSRRAR